MDSCCESKEHELTALRSRQGRVLVAVLAINGVMFCVEFGAGILSHSTALLGDSLDMLGDAMVYGISLYVLRRGQVWRARAALTKGAIMLVFGVAVLLEAGLKLRVGVLPVAYTMAGIGSLALAANAFCFALLWRHRSDDINLRSTWLCSRNDVVANGAVLVAAALVASFHSVWPDVLVGIGIAALFLRTAISVLRDAHAELGHNTTLSPAGVAAIDQGKPSHT
jgi:cation diffusion facilitator family transporter